MSNWERVYAMSFASVYPHYVNKAVGKGRTKEELHEIITWLAGHTTVGLQKSDRGEEEFWEFFEEAPKLNPNASLIKGVVCGVRVEDIEDPLMQKIDPLPRQTHRRTRTRQKDGKDPADSRLIDVRTRSDSDWVFQWQPMI